MEKIKIKSKNKIRNLKKEQRGKLSKSIVKANSQKIADKFFNQFDISKIHVLHTYLPIVKNNEVDTTLIIEHIWQNYPGVEIYIPYIDDKINNDIHVSVRLSSLDNLTMNKFGITQTTNKQNTLEDFSKIDIILIPLITFDMYGHRLGYGCGYYDRLLSKMSRRTKKIGLGYELLKSEEILPKNNTDIKLDYVLTERSIYFIHG